MIFSAIHFIDVRLIALFVVLLGPAHCAAISALLSPTEAVIQRRHFLLVLFSICVPTIFLVCSFFIYLLIFFVVSFVLLLLLFRSLFLLLFGLLRV